MNPTTCDCDPPQPAPNGRCKLCGHLLTAPELPPESFPQWTVKLVGRKEMTFKAELVLCRDHDLTLHADGNLIAAFPREKVFAIFREEFDLTALLEVDFNPLDHEQTK